MRRDGRPHRRYADRAANLHRQPPCRRPCRACHARTRGQARRLDRQRARVACGQRVMTLASEKRFRAALVQLRSGRDADANARSAEALIRRAAEGGAAHVQTPENTALMELKPERILEAAKTEEASAPLARFRALASELGIFLHIGSLAIRLDGTRVANRSYLIDPEGKIAARYDKLHLFDVDLAGGGG